MWLMLSLVMVLGSFFRVWGVSHVPPELFGDEVDVGYQAYSLLKTGRDLYNQSMPTLIHSLSEWRAPLLVYQTVPTIAVFGLSDYGVRLPEIVMGMLSPLILFILVYRHSRSKWTALVAASVMACMPWHIIFSRMGAFGAVTLINLIMLSLILFQKQKYVWSIIFVVLSFYTYNTALVFLPLLYIPLMFINKYKVSLVHVLIGLALMVPLGLQIVRGTADNRFSQISLASGTDILDNINIGRKDTPGLLGRVLYNRPAQYLRVFTRNYFQSFSTEFLFLRGDPVVRHSVQIVGGLLPATAIFLILGLVALARKKEWFWLTWLFLAPIASALTVDGGYHATRNFLMVPALAAIIAVGIVEVKTKKILMAVLLGICVLQFVNFYYYYQTVYSAKSWRWWGVGYQDAITALDKIAPDYSRVFINNNYEPSLVRFLFWTKYNPVKFHKDFTIDQDTNNIVPNYNGFSLDGKYFFGNFTKGDWTKIILPNSLYLISQADNVAGDWDWRISPPDNITVLHTSTNAYNQPIFYLVTKKQ